MSIVTKTGDEGWTSLWSGERVEKDDPRVEAYGTVDELSSFLGLARHACVKAEVVQALDRVQADLVRLAGELASKREAKNPICSEDVERLTAEVRALEGSIPLKGFVVPGMTESSARLDVARAVTRRAERLVVGLSRSVPIGKNLRLYLNRLSDLLFMLARAEEAAEGKIRFA